MKDETFGNQVFLQMHHNSPPERMLSETGMQAIWCRTAWDSNCREAADIAANGDHTRVLVAYEAMVTLPEGYSLPEGPDPEQAVYHLLGRDEQFAGLVNTWAKEIQQDVHQVGGDDSHYDYFPDYVAGFHQLCSAIGSTEAKIAYNETLDVIQRSEPYADDPETEDLFTGRFEL